MSHPTESPGEVLQRLLDRPFVQRPDPVRADLLVDRRRHRVALLQQSVWTDLAADRPLRDLPRFRTEAYRLASVSWEDRWAYGRVAHSEELCAEVARREGRWEVAWTAWRTAWWIRHTSGQDLGGRRDVVMGLLHAKLKRWDDAEQRLGEGLEVLTSGEVADVRRLWQAVASGDRF